MCGYELDQTETAPTLPSAPADDEGPTVPSKEQAPALPTRSRSGPLPLRETQYEVLRQIGKGGMGTVWLVRDPRNGLQLCIKRPQDLGEEVIARFLGEIRVLANNWQRNIVECLDFGRDAEGPFLVMPYYPNGSLRERVKARGPLDAKALLDLAKAMGRALAHLHGKSILHRDIKPGNILLDNDEQPVLADFGLVRVQSDNASSSGGSVVGTRAYMAPEQHEGAPASVATDIYSLGLTLRYAATGCLPGAGREDEVPAALRPLILRCTRQLPGQRYASAQDFLRAVENATPILVGSADLSCPHCSAAVERDAQHCPDCGKPLYSRCGACSKPMRIQARHCEKCGCSVETWSKVLQKQRETEDLLRNGRFDDVLGSINETARMHPAAQSLAEDMRRKLFALEPKVKDLRRRAWQAERESGPRAAGDLWRQLVELIPGDAEARKLVQTLPARIRSHAFERERVAVESLLAAGDLDAADAALAQLLPLAGGDDEAEAVCEGLELRIATTRGRAADQRAARIEERLRAGDLRGAKVAIAEARAAGSPSDALAPFEARLASIGRAVWRRDLMLTTGVVVAILTLVGGLLVYSDRTSMEQGIAAFRDGRFTAARSAFGRVWFELLTQGAQPAGTAARALEAAGVDWDTVTAAAIDDARGALAGQAACAPLAQALEERLPAALRKEVEALRLVAGRDRLLRADGTPLPPADSSAWSFRLAEDVPPGDGVAVACVRGQGQATIVRADLRRKLTGPTLTAADRIAGEAGRPLAITVRIDDGEARPDDPAPTIACATTSGDGRLATISPVADGLCTVTVAASTPGESTFAIAAQDFCGNPGAERRVVVAFAPAPAPVDPRPPAAPTLRTQSPAATREPRLQLAAIAAGADEVRAVDDKGAVVGALGADRDGFAGGVALVDGPNRLRLIARNANGDSPALELPVITLDRTPPTTRSARPRTIEVGQELALEFDEPLAADRTEAAGATLTGARVRFAPVAAPGRFALAIQPVDGVGNIGERVEWSGRAVRRTTLRAAGDAKAFQLPGRAALLAATPSAFALLSLAGDGAETRFGDLGPIAFASAVRNGDLFLLHAGGYASRWRNGKLAQAALLPRLLLRQDETVQAFCAVPGEEHVLALTDAGAVRFRLDNGAREEAGLGRPSGRARRLVATTRGFVALLADGRVEHAEGLRPARWSQEAAAGTAPVGATALVALPANGAALVATDRGEVLRGVPAAAQGAGFEWTTLVAADGVAVTALACEDPKLGFAMAMADGTVRVHAAIDASGGEPVVIDAADGETIVAIAGPSRIGADGMHVVYATAAGTIVAMEYE